MEMYGDIIMPEAFKCLTFFYVILLPPTDLFTALVSLLNLPIYVTFFPSSAYHCENFKPEGFSALQ